MNFKDYQKKSGDHSILKELKLDTVLYLMVGLTGEMGELAEKIKKTYRDHNKVFNDERKMLIKKEVGDVMWYLTQLCSELDISLNDAAEDNLKKLSLRREKNLIHGEGDLRS